MQGPRRTDDALPDAVVLAGAWAWRILAVAAVVALLLFLITELSLIVIPLMVAVLLAALLVPASRFLTRHGVPRWLAIVITLVVVVAVLVGLNALVVSQVVYGFPDLRHRSFEAYKNVKVYLTTGSYHFTEKQLNGFFRDTVTAINDDSQNILASALSFGSSFGHFVTGILLTAFATIILLIDGSGVWRWIVRLFPRRARAAVSGAGSAGWLTLTTFVKVQLFVALVDAVGIGVIAAVLGVPLAIPIAVVVFLGSFIPVVGAVVTGAIAVFLALVYNGPLIALIMLAGVLVIQQVEGHVLQPLVMGTAVRVHPLAVVFAVATGTLVAGVPGALFAVPVVATLNAMIGFIASGRWRQTLSPPDNDVMPPPLAARTADAVQKGLPDDV